MFKHFQDWINRNRAKRFKKALGKAYADYMVGKIIFEGEKGSIRGIISASAVEGAPKTSEEILADLKHAANMMSRRAGK